MSHNASNVFRLESRALFLHMAFVRLVSSILAILIPASLDD